MTSSRMLRCVALVRSDVSKEGRFIQEPHGVRSRKTEFLIDICSTESVHRAETVLKLKNGVFWDVTPGGSCKNRRFGATSASFISVTRFGELGTTLAVTLFAACVGC
jgi:hypothetical protein